MLAWIVEELAAEGRMRFAEIARPTPVGDQALVRVEAAAVNFLDTLMIRGRYQVKPQLPFTPGIEVAGIVERAGPDSPYKAGDKLCAMLDHGGFAQYALVSRVGSQRVPDDIASLQAVTLPIVYVTAYLALRDRARLRAGETLLVHAGAGGVGSAAIQLGRHWGARVIATAGGADKAALCRDLGADVVIDYDAEPVVDAVRRATDGRGADVIVDPVGGQVALDSLRCLAWGARYLVVGFASGTIPSLPANRLMLKNAAAMGVYAGEYRTHAPALVAEACSSMFGLLRSGAIVPLVRHVFPLGEADAALAAIAARRTVGKVVLVP